ncbi:pleckstrin homology domain-containing family F member 2 isoform X2 [Lepeophtheirus salmonis]|uniref:Pleckstrin homology domain-containing family F member 2 n=1 Tax=Lepeophtheirus salmonis TaxID=72036 RepID=C1BVW4_LEPSM|nr:pleckstrin homology domain-containing family F member 2-like isoform X2 [Lepeophtheirus salmonis]ACO13167.1 Pleckstrin homology domain-containing family F member 2 [Lepeophtheirus salmonis]
MVDQLVNTDINKKRIAFVESCFGSAGLPLAVKGRVLVGEGILTKACRKKPKPRQFFLFDDIVVYGNILINKKKYNKQRVIPLEEVKLQSLEDDGQFRNGWLICTRGKSFAVYAATAKEKDDWMSHIQRCIDDLLSSSGKKPSDEHAAVWIPDSEAHSCMVCNKSHFTVLNRRHHCRQCGAVVCGSCSTNRFLIPSQSSKPIRVCDTCYGTLNINKSSKNSSINDHKNVYSSGEDESDEDEQNDSRRNDKESHESYWYDSSTRIVSGVATLPAITAHDLNLSPLSQISPLPRAASSKK